MKNVDPKVVAGFGDEWSRFDQSNADRFGTRLEKRFSRVEMERMMIVAGLTDIRFNEHPPFWTAVGIKA